MIEGAPYILVVDDEANMLIAYKTFLKPDYNPILCSNGTEALQKLTEYSFSAAILDLKMPDMDGLELLEKIKEHDSDLGVIMSTATNDVKYAVQAIKKGAFEYVTKPFQYEEILGLVAKIVERRELRKENFYLKSALKEQQSFSDLIGQTSVMRNVFMIIENMNSVGSTVLITGESGTGKELVAHAIHQRSDRKNKPFVVVNCAAIPENLFESELFGHERGSFTGAFERKIGKFELADTGTIFLDEIGCLPQSMQAKLLRILQDNHIERVGGKGPIKISVRIVAATNTDLEQALKNKSFREDLFYRLNVIPIKLPPLRERRADLPLLIEYFLKKFNEELKKQIAGIDRQVMNELLEYDWPGNIRELKNVIERAVVLTKNGMITDISLRGKAVNGMPETLTSLKEASAEFEKEYIKKALAKTGGNQSETSRLLGIHRTTLISKMNLLGLK
ncbi:hypothetical protein A2276_07080 [candidate division WOR-1 bacterium RIFOXYA12_FULL_43_27]|uniref:Fis family transcriptional regulator n=1 Tax=candidate division WOR-1 bacterium RIFOXYC2_FULL_46_14 TaxID=1802587 RepID=A0A1F4U326_UNCSA|nr:MAG: hypothetical protein A2276_07080 [candidate division WOR-1 bacterium RIFOXYA12_FULL_43_27]OGC18945.1 MAG: hypothetical protein A2292_07935 [candidate division WOR-1 bacterium RIFOXYB2_FULL_46_45]OGC29087.1 MAG: hypothetical protein A2232_03000 [candidate division WOR-1 bacterium RIFOXYA2_FULL_46_56]OGC39385.1 MAG: hypothetical protein A2438_06615 [candidate division WOR-1 bacterium RIFOXYC2_FULL_46_14]